GSGATRSEQVRVMGLDLKEAHYEFSMRHLHAETLQKLMAAMKAGPAQAAPERIKGPVMDLLRHDPWFEIDRLGIVTSEGEAMVKGTVRLAEVTEQDMATGWSGLVSRVVADFRIEVPETLLRKMPNGETMSGSAIND